MMIYFDISRVNEGRRKLFRDTVSVLGELDIENSEKFSVDVDNDINYKEFAEMIIEEGFRIYKHELNTVFIKDE